MKTVVSECGAVRIMYSVSCPAADTICSSPLPRCLRLSPTVAFWLTLFILAASALEVA